MSESTEADLASTIEDVVHRYGIAQVVNRLADVCMENYNSLYDAVDEQEVNNWQGYGPEQWRGIGTQLRILEQVIAHIHDGDIPF